MKLSRRKWEAEAATNNACSLLSLAERLNNDGEDDTHLIGFSLGAMTATRLAVLLGERVVRVDCTSGAAPLDLGNFLSHMAGKPVFTFAKVRLDEKRRQGA